MTAVPTWAAAPAVAVLVGVAVVPGTGAGRVERLAGAGRLVPRGRSRAVIGSGLSERFVARALGGAAALAVAAVLVTAGVALAVAMAALLAVPGTLLRDLRRSRQDAARRRDLATGLRVLIAELEAGSQASDALAAAATVGSPGSELAKTFAAAAGAAAEGADAGRVLAETAELRHVGLAWQLGESTGTALAAVLSRVAADLAADEDQRRAATVALAGPRSSAAVLALLPALGIALGAAMGAHPVPFLLGSPAGRMLCCAGVLLDAGGVLWLRAILRRAVRT